MTQANNLPFDINAAIAAEAETSKDMNVAQKGGGTYTPPAAGLVRLRLVGYYELGKKEDSFEGKPKVTDEVSLVFELSGPKHAAKVMDDGTKIPQRITISLHKSLHEKAGFYKLFKAMNYKGTAKIMAQLLGESFLGTIFHKAWKSDATKVSAQLKDPVTGAFSIRPPIVEDADTGESRTVNVEPAITPLKAFLWNNPSKAMWASIYVAGQYDEVKNDDGTVKFPAKSKNILQDRIKSAINFEGSPIANLLVGDLDMEVDKPGKAKASSGSVGSATPADEASTEPTPAAADEGDDPLGMF